MTSAETHTNVMTDRCRLGKPRATSSDHVRSTWTSTLMTVGAVTRNGSKRPSLQGACTCVGLGSIACEKECLSSEDVCTFDMVQS